MPASTSYCGEQRNASVSRAGCRRFDPRLALADTQRVNCIEVRGTRGSYGAKKRVGRKRVAFIAVDGPDLAAKLAREWYQAGAVSDPDTAMIRPPDRAP